MPVRISLPPEPVLVQAVPPPIVPESVAPAEFVTLMVPVLLSVTPLLDETPRFQRSGVCRRRRQCSSQVEVGVGAATESTPALTLVAPEYVLFPERTVAARAGLGHAAGVRNLAGVGQRG